MQAIRRAFGNLNYKSGNDRLVSKAWWSICFRQIGLAGVDPAFERGEKMADPYIEDDGAEFPINNCVRCGQTDYVVAYGDDEVKLGKMKSQVPRGPKAKFLPKVAAPVRK